MKDFRSFFLLWASQTISNAGDVFYIVGLISAVYLSSNSVMTISLIPVTITVSRLIGSFITPILIHRFPLKQILVSSMFGKIIVLFAVFIVHEGSLLWVLLLVSLNAFLDGWASPTRNAMIPEFAGKAALVKANSITAISDNTVFLISWPIGALFTSAFGSAKLIALTVFIYFMAWILMLFVNKVQNDEEKEELNLLQQIMDGWNYIFMEPSVKTIMIIDLFSAAASVVWASAFLLVYADEVLGKGEEWWGYINSVYSAGFIIGGLLFSKLTKIKFHTMIIWCSFLTVIFTIGFAVPYGVWIALFIAFLLGIVGQLQGIAQLTIVQTNTISEKLAKVFSAQDVVVTGGYAIAMLLFGWLGEVMDIRIVFILSGILTLCTTAIAIWKRKYLVQQL